MKSKRRVVITGLGVVAPNGIGKDAFWENLIAGKSAVDWITSFDTTPYPCKVAAEVRDFDPSAFVPARRSRHWGRFSQFAVAAGKLALEDSKIDLARELPDRVLACVGTAINGTADVYERARVSFGRVGLPGIHWTSPTEFAANAPITHLSTELRIRGQGMTIASACATGIDAIQWACSQIQECKGDVVLAGSTEAPLTEFCFAGICAAGVLSTFDDPPLRAARPYERRRSGMVLGEGSSMCVVEEMEHALDRGAYIYAEILGFGSGNEGGFPARNNASELSLTHAITSALRAGDASPNDIDYVNAHGNSLVEYDRVDTRALRAALGSAADSVPVSSIKSMIGHALGAAASFQLAATCLTLAHSVIPPTINYDEPDPECDLDYVPNHARIARVRTALINAHAAGGTHSVVLLGATDTR